MYKAKNNPLWDYLKESYRFTPVKQNLLPLERIPYEKKYLSQERFVIEFKKLLDKYDKDGVKISRDMILEMLHTQRLMHTKEAFDVVNPRAPIIYQTPNQNYVLTQNMTPVITLPSKLSRIDNVTLHEYEHHLNKALHNELAMDRVIDGKRHYPDTALIVSNLQSVHIELMTRKSGQGIENGND